MTSLGTIQNHWNIINKSLKIIEKYNDTYAMSVLYNNIEEFTKHLINMI